MWDSPQKTSILLFALFFLVWEMGWLVLYTVGFTFSSGSGSIKDDKYLARRVLSLVWSSLHQGFYLLSERKLAKRIEYII